MELPRWASRSVGAAAGLALVAALPAATSFASAGASVTGPVVKLVAAQKSISVQRFGQQVDLDPGVYVTAYGAPLEFDVSRASYGKPVTISQVLKVDGRTVLRPLPSRMIDGWNGLRRFLRMTIRNTSGKIVGSSLMTFCPDSSNPQRASPNSPADSLFPTECGDNPFEKGMVWGIQQGWGVDPVGSGIVVIEPGGGVGPSYRLRVGHYVVTVSITRLWQRLLHIPAGDATATVKVKVVKGHGCMDICPPLPARKTRPMTRPSLPRVPTLSHPPASILPDLIPLPSWGIGVDNSRATAKHPQRSFLSFAATVWIGGHSRFDVEGFSTRHSPVMKAYQYFWRGGRVVGRAPAGTMGFGTRWGGGYRWHFAQWAQFRLLDASKSVVLRSQKVGFCIEPTDAIDLLLPHATWQPNYSGPTGDCGSPSALWAQEALPLGWGDTYECVGGQSFNISHLPNGTYYIEVIANPEHLLHETNYRNDISLRKVMLGGTPGHRTVRVPAYHGIDPEH